MNRININPKTWGESGWNLLDSVVAGYPLVATKRFQESAIKFFVSLGDMLPCLKCRRNYKNFIRKHHPNKFVRTRNDIGLWLEELKKHAKPNQSVTFR